MTNRNFFSGLEYFVLLTIRSEGPSGVRHIRLHIEETVRSSVSHGSVYKILVRFTERGLLKATKIPHGENKDERSWTSYNLTRKGHGALLKHRNNIKKLDSTSDE